MKPPVNPQVFLRRQRRWAQTTPLLCAGVAALAAACWVDAARLEWIPADPRWAWLAVGASAALLAVGAQRWWRLALTEVAQLSDHRWGLQARLESVAELAASDTPLARLQRTDAAARLENRRPPGWFLGLGAALAVILLGGLLSWETFQLAQPSPPTPLSAAPAAPVPAAQPVTALPPPAPVPFVPKAVITWIKPRGTLTAHTTDTVPLQAAVQANYAVSSMALKVAVNGRPVGLYPTGAPSAGGSVLAQLYLDETGACPRDVVSYQLVIPAGQTTPAVHSVIQYINLAPVGATAAPAGSRGSGVINRLAQLQAAQQRLLERSAVLTEQAKLPTLAATAQPAGKLAAEQTALRDQLQAIAASLSSNRPELSQDLAAARAAMEQAASALGANRLADAAASQSAALDALAAAQRDLDVASLPRAQVSAALPRRAGTPAGRLERVAQQQAALSRDLAAQSVTRAQQAEWSSWESAIARDLNQLSQSGGLTPEVQAQLAQARAAVAEANRQLAAADYQAAALPAAQAAAALQQATQLQEQQGRQAASSLLNEVRQQLNQSGSSSPAQVAALQRQLMAEAQRQQQQGSSPAAQQLQQVAQQLRPVPASSTPPPTDQLQQSAPPQQSSPQSGTSSPTSSNQPTPAKSSQEKSPSQTSPPSQSPSQQSETQQPQPQQSQQQQSPTPQSQQQTQSQQKPSRSQPSQSQQSQAGQSQSQQQQSQPKPSRSQPSQSQQSPSEQAQSQQSQPQSDSSSSSGESSSSAGTSTSSAGATPPQAVAPKIPPPGDYTSNPNSQMVVVAQALLDDQLLNRTVHGLVLSSDKLAANTDPKLVQQMTSQVASAAQIVQAQRAFGSQHRRGDQVLRQIADLNQRLIRSYSPKNRSHWSADELKDLAEQTRQLANSLEIMSDDRHRDEKLKQFNPQALDPVYRQPVERYFELLSRDPAP